MLSPLFRGYFNQPTPSDSSSSSPSDPNNSNNSNPPNPYDTIRKGNGWDGEGTISSNDTIINAARQKAMGKITSRQGGGKLRRLPRQKKQSGAAVLDPKDSSSTTTATPSSRGTTPSPHDALLTPSTMSTIECTERFSLRSRDTHLYVATVSAENNNNNNSSHNLTSPLPPLSEAEGQEGEVSVWELFDGDGDLDARARTSCNAPEFHPLSSNRIHVKRQVTVVTSHK